MYQRLFDHPSIQLHIKNRGKASEPKDDDLIMHYIFEHKFERSCAIGKQGECVIHNDPKLVNN